jgi:glycosyltransferase involved in cell wall biosynthesis
MRVLHVVSRVGRGGIETYLLSLAAQTRLVGVDLEILCVGTNATAADALTGSFGELGVTIHYIKLFRSPLLAVARLRQLVRRRRYDAIHCHLGDWSATLMVACAGLNVPVIASYHNANYRPEQAFLRRVTVPFMRAIIRLSHGPISGCSRHAILSHLPGLAAKRVRPVYYGVDVSRFRPPTATESEAARRQFEIPPECSVISHVGRFVPEKNHELILDVADRIRRQVPAIRFILAGSGPLYPTVRQRVRELDLDGIVIFTGEIEHPERVLWASDVFLFPSHSEGLGLALLEAAACGVAVVAAAIPVLSEIAADWPGVTLCVKPTEYDVALTQVLEGGRRNRPDPRTRAVADFSIASSAFQWQRLMKDAAQ